MLSTIKAEIEQYMTGGTKEGATMKSRFAFPAEFIGFQGHFPEKKILPGVCQIQCALSTFEKGAGKAVILKEVVLAKYFSPVFPNDEVTCVVNEPAGCGQRVHRKSGHHERCRQDLGTEAAALLRGPGRQTLG